MKQILVIVLILLIVGCTSTQTIDDPIVKDELETKQKPLVVEKEIHGVAHIGETRTLGILNIYQEAFTPEVKMQTLQGDGSVLSFSPVSVPELQPGESVTVPISITSQTEGTFLLRLVVLENGREYAKENIMFVVGPLD